MDATGKGGSMESILKMDEVEKGREHAKRRHALLCIAMNLDGEMVDHPIYGALLGECFETVADACGVEVGELNELLEAAKSDMSMLRREG